MRKSIVLHEIISYGKLQNLTLLQRRMRRQKKGEIESTMAAESLSHTHNIAAILTASDGWCRGCWWGGCYWKYIWKMGIFVSRKRDVWVSQRVINAMSEIGNFSTTFENFKI